MIARTARRTRDYLTVRHDGRRGARSVSRHDVQ